MRIISQDRRGDAGQGENLVHRAAKDGFTGHAEYNAAGLVLGYRKRLRLFHLEEAIGAVVAHAGHENPDGAGTRGLCDGPEQYIDARPMAGNERSFTDLEKISRADTVDKHVAIPGSYIGAARDHFVAMRRLPDFDPAYSIESPCERRRKTFGHMLDDDDTRTTFRHLTEDLDSAR